jgi:hypothetical protein
LTASRDFTARMIEITIDAIRAPSKSLRNRIGVKPGSVPYTAFFRTGVHRRREEGTPRRRYTLLVAKGAVGSGIIAVLTAAREVFSADREFLDPSGSRFACIGDVPAFSPIHLPRGAPWMPAAWNWSAYQG